eukprot:jgi/Mesvir1/8469/Mv15837-RA.1
MFHVWGFAFSALSALANGSFSVFSKLETVRKAGIDPYLFNFWTCIGIILSSVAGLFVDELCFTPRGLLSGLLFTLATANAFSAINLINLAVASGVWCGTAIIVSFLYGIAFSPATDPHNVWLAALAIVSLLLGTVGISAAGRGHIHRENSLPLLVDDDDTLLLSSIRRGQKKKLSLGLFAAVVAGTLGGLVLAPRESAPHECQGVGYILPFGVGVLLSVGPVTAIPFLVRREWPDLHLRHPKEVALPGITSGVVWNIGNLFSIVAVHELGLAIAYPIMQCGLFVSGAWGIFLFQEIHGRNAALYWLSGIFVVGGAVMLAFSK